VLAASLRAGSDDMSLYAGFLIYELVEVERKTGMFGRVKDDAPVLGVGVRLGDHRFALRREGVGKPVVAQVKHESGGVVMRTETVSMDVWSGQLAQALAEYAESNARAAQVLQRLTSPELPS
jgi:hypothetical protein